MQANEQVTKFILAMDELEHAELLKLLERELRDTRVEAGARNRPITRTRCITKNRSWKA